MNSSLRFVIAVLVAGSLGCGFGGGSTRVPGDDRDLTEIGCLGVEFGPQSDEDEPGVIVTRVITDSPAAKFGIVRGDRLTHVDGRKIRTPADFRRVRRRWEPEQTIKLEFVRADTLREAHVRLIDGIELRSLYYVDELK